MATSLSLTRDDIIKAALRRIGVLGQGETPDSNETTEAALALNTLIKQFDGFTWFKWFIKSANAFVPTVAGTSSYDLDAETKWVEAVTYDDGTVEHSLEPMTIGEYARIPRKASLGIPTHYFVSYDLDTPKIFVYPTPVATATINYWYRRKVDTFETANDTLDVPEEWGRFLILQLAADLASEYGKPLDERQLLLQQASSALQSIIGKEGMQITGQTVTAESPTLNASPDAMKLPRPTPNVK